MGKRACSFLPAATQMIYDLELQKHLFGVTFECPENALLEKPRVVRSILEDKELSSAEIDKIYSASKSEGKSLYYVDEELLQQIAPDVIFLQEVCEICQIDTKCTAAAVDKLSRRPELISLSPNNLKDVFACLLTTAKALNSEEKAYFFLSDIHKKIDEIVDSLRRERAPLRRVMLMEWVDPIYNCGHWIPDQIAYAGGVDMLSNPGGDSIRIPWEKVVQYNPEVLVIAPCGFETGRTREDMPRLEKRKEWRDLSAVKNDEVYLVDYDVFTQPSPGTLMKGVEILASLFHPEIFQLSPTLKNKVLHYQSTEHIFHGH